MNKEVKYIWIVETQNIHADGRNGGKSHSYFSSREKSMLHIEWVKACCENNNAQIIDWDNAKMSGSYELTNGDTWIIKTERKALDLDDLFIGEC